MIVQMTRSVLLVRARRVCTRRCQV